MCKKFKVSCKFFHWHILNIFQDFIKIIHTFINFLIYRYYYSMYLISPREIVLCKPGAYFKYFHISKFSFID